MVNAGTQIPIMAMVMVPQSTQLFLRTAEIIPMGTPMQIAMPRALRPRITDTLKDWEMMSLTGRPLLVETANEPSVMMFFG